MTFASSSDVADLKDILYGVHMRVLELEEEMKELKNTVQEMETLLNRNKQLGRLK